MAKEPVSDPGLKTWIVNGSPVTATLVHAWTDAEKRLPLWLRGNGLPRRVTEPAEQVFLQHEHSALLANLMAMVRLAQDAVTNILTVRRDHGTTPDAMDPDVFAHNVVFGLRSARDEVLLLTPAAHVPVVTTRLDRFIDATRAALDAFMGEPLDRILCEKPTCPSGSHLLPGPWIDAMKRSVDAGDDALRLWTVIGGDTTSPEPPAGRSAALPAGGEPKRKKRKGQVGEAETTGGGNAAQVTDHHRPALWIAKATNNGLTRDNLKVMRRRGKLTGCIRSEEKGHWLYDVPEVAEKRPVYAAQLMDALKDEADFRKPRASERAGTKRDKAGQSGTSIGAA